MCIKLTQQAKNEAYKKKVGQTPRQITDVIQKKNAGSLVATEKLPLCDNWQQLFQPLMQWFPTGVPTACVLRRFQSGPLTWLRDVLSNELLIQEILSHFLLSNFHDHDINQL
jgi:hypothetical protein